jgi:surfactin synthase thioesterase subunit
MFFGHCLGGLTAFETARRLQRQGPLDLRHLFVSGARSPRRLNQFGRFEEDLLARLLERPEFDALIALYDQAEDVVAEMIRQFNIGLTEDFLASAELRTLLMPAIRAEFRMGARYRFTPEPPWETAITCFNGLDDPYVAREDALAWSEHTRRLFRLHLREGAHFLVVDDRDFIVETINRELQP